MLPGRDEPPEPAVDIAHDTRPGHAALVLNERRALRIGRDAGRGPLLARLAARGRAGHRLRGGRRLAGVAQYDHAFALLVLARDADDFSEGHVGLLGPRFDLRFQDTPENW